MLEGEPDLDQKLGAIQGQAKEAGDLLDRTGKALERTHPKAQHPELHQRLGDLQQKRREADDLLGKARYAAAYRKALHKVGLKPTDVVTRFGGEARQFALSNLRRGKYINAVETKDGRRVKLDPPVEVPPQTDVRGHGDNPLWMARLRIGQPRVTAEQAKEQRERLAQQVQAQQMQARQQKPAKPVAEAADPDNPDSLMRHYAPAIAGKNAEVLKTFKRQVIGYIKWTHAADVDNGIPTGYEPEDLVRVRKAKTFEEVEAILAQFEGEPSFLYMIRAGYF